MTDKDARLVNYLGIRCRIDKIEKDLPRFSKDLSKSSAANFPRLGTSIMVVTKTQSAESIEPLCRYGHRLFGENRVQEAKSKWGVLQGKYSEIDLHLIGSLQSNKAKEAVCLFGTIQSVDRLSLIGSLSKAESTLGLKRRYMIQVNLGNESQKGGCLWSDTESLLLSARSAGLAVVGLMGIPPLGLDPSELFHRLRALSRGLLLDHCSMGMSCDFEQAVKAGSTMVRLGSVIFGLRE